MQYERVFVPGKSLKPILMIASQVGAYQVEKLSGAPFLGENVRSGYKGAQVKNTLVH
jgi:hypothetical protein